jgi:hypothetical protein
MRSAPRAFRQGWFLLEMVSRELARIPLTAAGSGLSAYHQANAITEILLMN